MYPTADRIVVFLPEGDRRHVDLLCAVMNVSRSELFRMLLAGLRNTNHEGEKE